MLPLIITCIILFVGFKTKPQPTTFRPFLVKHIEEEHKQTSDNGGGAGGFFSRLLSMRSAPSIPDFKLTDGLLFVIANTEDGRIFVGVFGSWFQVSSQNAESGGSSSSGAQPLGVLFSSSASASQSHGGRNAQQQQEEMASQEAEQAKSQALHYKGKRDYSSAASFYMKAGNSYSRLQNERSSSSLNEMNISAAAQCFEDAANCYKLLNMHDRYLEANLKAAALFAGMERWSSRAGRIWEKVGTEMTTKDPSKALQYLEKARGAFESCGDG
jgi:hypothetical protein